MCLKTNFRGYHGTDKSHFDSLDKDKEFSSQTLPCDLGNGLYVFIDRVNKTGEAIENAKKYLSRWKPKYKNKIIVEMELDLEQDKVLDLDDQVNQDIFNLFIDENEEDIYREYSAIKKKSVCKELW